MSKGINRLKLAVLGSNASAAPTKQNTERRGEKKLSLKRVQCGLHQKGVDARLLNRRDSSKLDFA